jgi:murein DD-endopeptidase MepM/ murein hydrolase activator NlpD
LIYNFLKEGFRQLRRSFDHLLSPELAIMERKLEKKRIATPVWNQQKLAWQKMRYSYYARQSRVTKTVVAVLLTSVLMVGAAFPRMVYQVMVNDQCIGTVRSTETVQKIVDAYLAEKGENLPYALVVDPAVSYFPVRQTESLTSVQQLQTDLLHAVTVKAQASVIHIADKATVALAGSAEVNQVLDNVKLFYTGNQPGLETLQAQFSEELVVRREVVDLEEIKTIDEATAIMVSGSERREVVTIEAGDTLWDIAMSQSISLDELLEKNPNASSLQPGDQLVITQAEPLVGVVTNETTREEIVIPYETETRYSDTMYVTEVEELVAGQNGFKIEEFAITRQNGEEVSRASLGISLIQEPVTRVILKGTQLPYGVGTGTFIWPMYGNVTAWWGWYEYGYHRGIDIASGYGRGTVMAADSGVVVGIGYDYFGLGNYITIDHNNGYVTKYAHLSSFLVSYGQAVRQGDAIGIEGNTGYSFGNHLHFEVHVNGTRVNPYYYLP